jgi:hypothetical protein
MTIRDRGKVKWQGAFFMPEHVKMLKEFKSDYHKQLKPILNQYEIEEIENRIHEAMEFTLTLKITTWFDGFFYDFEGLVNRLDGMGKVIYLELSDGIMERIKFVDIVRVEIKEN